MTPNLGCVIVTYNSADCILECLQSLHMATHIKMHIVLVDNASSDSTVRDIKQWMQTHDHSITLIQAQENSGFAAGVNLGLELLRQNPKLDRFWILNPDCTVPPNTPKALAETPLPFALLGCRVIYKSTPDIIQIDGGRINRWTGATQSINIGAKVKTTPLPDAQDLDFISGASMVASRAFLDASGPIPEHYFLYYEEVDWAQRRGDLPLKICSDAHVIHAAGASIGSPTLTRGPSELSVYFKHFARMRFMVRYHPSRVVIAYLFGWGKLLQHISRGQYSVLPALLRALHGLGPSTAIKAKISAPVQAATKPRILSNSST